MSSNAEMARAVGCIVSDDGTGDIRVIVDHALAADASATAEDIAALVREARADAAAESAQDDEPEAASATYTYTYTIYDSGPHSSSGTAWPTHEDIEIEAGSDEEAIEAVRDIMSTEAAGLNPTDGYDVGQRLYACVWDSDQVIVGEPTYTLTDDDLGVTSDEESE
jgi:hypothetical protein